MNQFRTPFFIRILNLFRDRNSKLVLFSTLAFFCLLSGYFVLRPLRDEMGILNGAVNMQWLFTGTFVAMVGIVPFFGFLMNRYSIRKVLLYSYSFFLGNIIIFYILFALYGPSKNMAISFFIWLSVFNLFVVSLFWSFMADIFDGVSSKRFFGIITSGGSLGALTGPIIANQLSAMFAMDILLMVAAFFLLMALIFVIAILDLSDKPRHTRKPENQNKQTFKKIFEGIQHIYKSPYLLGIVGFMLLYTSISTVLYFEQAYIIEQALQKSIDRIKYFSRQDFIINAIAISGQFFLTARIIKKIGLAMVLASIPLIIAIGLMVLSQNTSLVTIAVLMVVHRSGNFMLMRPGREILYTVTESGEKYKAKNLIDTAIYRGGDAVVGWLFAAVTSLGWGLGVIAFIAVPISILWSFTGYRLGKGQTRKENTLILKN